MHELLRYFHSWKDITVTMYSNVESLYSKHYHTCSWVRYALGLFFFCIQSVEGNCQVDSSKNGKQFSISARGHFGFVLAHSIYTQNTKGARPYGAEIDYGWLDTSEQVFQKFHCYPRNGITANFTDMDFGFLGKSYSLGYFLEPNFPIGQKAILHLRSTLGLSYLTNPFDSLRNPTNQNYSLAISAFLQVGLAMSYPLSKHVQLQIGGGWNHNSNGGFKQPNRGLNYPNLSLGVQYNKSSTLLPHFKHRADTSWQDKPIYWDGGLFFSPKGGYDENIKQQRKFLGGLFIQGSKHIGAIHRLSLGAEIYYDGGMRSIKDNILKDSSSASFAGLLAGHEFVLNKFIFSQQLGFYVYKDTELYNKLYTDIYKTVYHRWGLRYLIKPHWSAGISLLAHNQVADFIDARFYYRF